jgi:hypothetical protein
MCFPQLRAALVSVVCLIAFLSGCTAYYGTVGRASETQVAPDSVAFFPTGYISWDLAYREPLLRCAELTIESGYRYFAVSAIENYSSATDFVPPASQSHGFHNAYTAYNPPPSSSIPFWPLPALTIKMLRAPIPNTGTRVQSRSSRSCVETAKGFGTELGGTAKTAWTGSINGNTTSTSFSCG